MTRPRTDDKLLAWHIRGVLHKHGKTTVRDICHFLRQTHRIDMSSVELASMVAHSPHLRGSIGRETKAFCTGRDTTDTYYYLVDG